MDKITISLKELSGLNLIEKFKSEGFEKFTRTMMDKQVISVASTFISHFSLQIKPREFLSSFLIAGFPEFTLSSQRNKLEEEVYQLAVKLTDSLNKEAFDQEDFRVLAEEYYTSFINWKNQDREDLVKIISETKQEIKSISETIPEEVTGPGLNETLGKLDKLAKQIGGDLATDQGQKHANLAKQHQILSETALSMHRAFWELFTSELSEDPPNFRQYPELVNEIKQRLLKVIPPLNHEEISEIVYEKLDQNKIVQKIKDSVYTLQDIYDLCIYCLNNIKIFGEPCDMDVIRFYEETVHQKMLENPVKIHEIIPNTFKVVLEKLDHIIQVQGSPPVS